MLGEKREWCSAVGLVILRLGFGGYMLTHGWPKMQSMLSGKLEFADPIGLGPAASHILIVLAEFVCPLLVMLGLGTRLAALPTVVAMGVAAFVAHAKDPWTMGAAAKGFLAGELESFGSKEPALLFATAFLALLFTGAGRLSLDALLFSGCCRAPGEAAPPSKKG